jgi:hypothetical protein
VTTALREGTFERLNVAVGSLGGAIERYAAARDDQRVAVADSRELWVIQIGVGALDVAQSRFFVNGCFMVSSGRDESHIFEEVYGWSVTCRERNQEGYSHVGSLLLRTSDEQFTVRLPG